MKVVVGFFKIFIILVYIISGISACVKPERDFTMKRKMEWKLENSKIEIVVGFDGDGYYLLKSLIEKQSGQSWIEKPLRLMEKAIYIDEKPVSLRLNKAKDGDFVFCEVAEQRQDEAMRTSITFEPDNVKITHHLGLYEKNSVVESWVGVENNSPSEVPITKIKSKESLVFCFRSEGEEQRMTLKPRRIEGEKRYQIKFYEQGKDLIMKGKEILSRGIEVELREKFSTEVIFITKI